MKIVGCDLHARQQTIAMMDMESGESPKRHFPMKGIPYASFTRA